MALLDQIQKDMVTAMKARDEARLDTVRMIKTALQRYTVNARRSQVEAWQARGDVQEVQPGLYLLVDELRYDQRLGLMAEGRPLDAASLVQ